MIYYCHIVVKLCVVHQMKKGNQIYWLRLAISLIILIGLSFGLAYLLQNLGARFQKATANDSFVCEYDARYPGIKIGRQIGLHGPHNGSRHFFVKQGRRVHDDYPTLRARQLADFGNRFFIFTASFCYFS